MKKLIVALLALLAVSAFATVETWEFEAVADTYVVYHRLDGVVQDITYENFGGEDQLKLYRYMDFGNPHYRILLKSILLDFNLSILDDSIEYTSLTLSLYLTDILELYPADWVCLSTIIEPWDEYTVTGADTPDCTDTIYTFGSSWWNHDQGTYASVELDPTYIYTLLEDETHGFILEYSIDAWDYLYYYFASREASNPPKLIVEYDDSAAIEETTWGQIKASY